MDSARSAHDDSFDLMQKEYEELYAQFAAEDEEYLAREMARLNAFAEENEEQTLTRGMPQGQATNDSRQDMPSAESTAYSWRYGDKRWHEFEAAAARVADSQAHCMSDASNMTK